MEKEIFLEGMKKLSAAYPDYELRDETLAVYFENLQQLSLPEWQMAITSHLRKHKWFPKISELLGALQASLPRAEEVWATLIRAAERDQKPPMDSPTQQALGAVGGWEAFSITPYDELKFKLKTFKEVFESVQGREGVGLELAGPEHLQVEHDAQK